MPPKVRVEENETLQKKHSLAFFMLVDTGLDAEKKKA